MTDQVQPEQLLQLIHSLINQVKWLEGELTLARNLDHSPTDWQKESHPIPFAPPVYVDGEPLPLPPGDVRGSYAVNDDKHYLNWGRTDHDFIMSLIEKYGSVKKDMAILDWGCSSGRVLRHFLKEHQAHNWRLHGVDILANLVEWMRRFFPREFDVFCVTMRPHLPFRDASLDVIYGMSVMTHTKFLWDMWLAEFRRVLKPGGICLMTVQCEYAWKFYHANRHEGWVNSQHPAWMLAKPEMDEDYFFYGNSVVSQTFYREKVVREWWGRIIRVIDFLPPPEPNFQNWVVMKND